MNPSSFCQKFSTYNEKKTKKTPPSKKSKQPPPQTINPKKPNKPQTCVFTLRIRRVHCVSLYFESFTNAFYYFRDKSISTRALLAYLLHKFLQLDFFFLLDMLGVHWKRSVPALINILICCLCSMPLIF